MSCEEVVNSNHFKFIWYLENFSSTPFDSIRSPCFRIPELNETSWCISAKLGESDQVKHITCYLHRMEGEFQKCDVKVRARMSVYGNIIPNGSEVVEKACFESGDGIKFVHVSMNTSSLSQPLLVSNVLRIECTLASCNDSEIKHYDDDLVQDVYSIFTSGLEADLRLSDGNNTFALHKAILFARLPVLFSELEIDYGSTDKVVNDPDEVIKTLIDYAYGAQYRASTTINVKALHEACDKYYLFDLHRQLHTWVPCCVIRTTIKIETRFVLMKYSRMISGEKESKFELRSLDLEVVSSPQLFLLLRMLQEDGSEFLHIYFSFPIFRKKSILMTCKLDIMDSLCPLEKFRVFRHQFESNEAWSPEFRIPKSTLKSMNGCLHGFRLDIQLSEGDQISHIEKEYVQNGTELGVESDFEQMSLDLQKLLDHENYLFCDTALVDKDKGQHFAHRAILNARSAALRQLVYVKNYGLYGVKFDDIGSSTLSAILHFIYTGKLKPLEIDEAVELHRVACEWELTNLVKLLVKHLNL